MPTVKLISAGESKCIKAECGCDAPANAILRDSVADVRQVFWLKNPSFKTPSRKIQWHIVLKRLDYSSGTARDLHPTSLLTALKAGLGQIRISIPLGRGDVKNFTIYLVKKSYRQLHVVEVSGFAGNLNAAWFY